jgi:hypothetical protein
VSKIAFIKDVQNNVQKHSIKNGVLKSVEYFVENKVSKKMSKWCQYKCQKPSCQKNVKMVSKEMLNILVSKIYRKKSQNQHPVLVVQLVKMFVEFFFVLGKFDTNFALPCLSLNAIAVISSFYLHPSTFVNEKHSSSIIMPDLFIREQG